MATNGVVSLRDIVTSCGVQCPVGKSADRFKCRLHSLLRRAAGEGKIPPRNGSNWCWSRTEPQLQAVVELVAKCLKRPVPECLPAGMQARGPAVLPLHGQENGSSGSAPTQTEPKRKHAASSGYMLFASDNFQLVRDELTATAQGAAPSFSDVARATASKWRTLLPSEQDEFVRRSAAAKQQAAREEAMQVVAKVGASSAGAEANSLAELSLVPRGMPPLAMQSTGSKLGGRKPKLLKPHQLQSLKRKWMQQEVSKAEVDLHREWEALSADEVASQLCAWRYSQLGGQTDNCKRRLCSTLDALISQRLEAKRQSSSPPGSVMDRLGLLEARLPHPAQLFLELRPISGVTSAEVEASAAEGLRRYMGLSPTQHAALWSVVAARSQRQEEAVLRMLRAQLGLDSLPKSLGHGLPGLDAFRAQRASRSPMLFLPGSCAIDALWELDTEQEFLSLEESVQECWLSAASVASSSLALPGREASAADSNWAPRSELRQQQQKQHCLPATDRNSWECYALGA
eukprot:TRINITY_DN95037_c0_g1_i1.p1 TRINITY_DN95037_c0_g1~~TRINITY_DN95037_c0_g1_i1.p1  ORF type:complete len:515 (+),score=102.54 TRINITY_DN95037_c0_g1_i1:59-1603(+)